MFAHPSFIYYFPLHMLNLSNSSMQSLALLCLVSCVTFIQKLTPRKDDDMTLEFVSLSPSPASLSDFWELSLVIFFQLIAPLLSIQQDSLG